MIHRVRVGALWLTFLLAAWPTGAVVKVKVLPNGTKVMYNDRPARPSWKPRPAQSEMPRRELERLIDEHARRQRLDPELVRAIVEVESAFRPWAMSHKGAMGLMQLMPDTARQLSVGDPWDPAENLRGGTTYFRRLLDVFDGRLELALAGYNAGPESVERYGGIPPYEETRTYVEKIMRIYRNEPGFALSPSRVTRVGRKAYLRQDENGRYLLTTTPVNNR